MNSEMAGKTAGGATLVSRVSDALRETIVSGALRPGDKLPTEARLAEAHGVSRTVIREAIATLRADGMVRARRGSGVFVLQPGEPPMLPFSDIDHARISSLIEVLELRTAIETEAARLAALRCSPAAEEDIVEAHREVGRLISAGKGAIEADFALHLAIVRATGNPRFVQFLALFGPSAIPRSALSREGGDATPALYLEQIHAEHGAIVAAIADHEPEAAAEAMRRHLQASQRRYRALLSEAGPM